MRGGTCGAQESARDARDAVGSGAQGCSSKMRAQQGKRPGARRACRYAKNAALPASRPPASASSPPGDVIAAALRRGSRRPAMSASMRV